MIAGAAVIAVVLIACIVATYIVGMISRDELDRANRAPRRRRD